MTGIGKAGALPGSIRDHQRGATDEELLILINDRVPYDKIMRITHVGHSRLKRLAGESRVDPSETHWTPQDGRDRRAGNKAMTLGRKLLAEAERARVNLLNLGVSPSGDLQVSVQIRIRCEMYRKWLIERAPFRQQNDPMFLLNVARCVAAYRAGIISQIQRL